MNAMPLRWLHRNLFGKPADAALTLVIVPFCAWVLIVILRWALVTADWHILADSARVLLIGIYPVEEIWRAWFCGFVLAAIAGGGLGILLPAAVPLLAGLAGAGLIGGLALLAAGAADGLRVVGCLWTALAAWAVLARSLSLRRLAGPVFLLAFGAMFLVLAGPGLERWGGLLLSVILTIATSCLVLPLGILLALGRQSRIGSVRVLCTAYIEVMRSIPLILVVYWIWIIVPLLLPDLPVPALLRGMAGYALFFSAYVAEYVRSGLQALPKGQIEAAQSLGMGTWSTNRDIVLPQALRVTLPALVGQVLDIFNGATLVFIIGLTDFLRSGQMILANPQNSSKIYEIYLTMFAVYFVIGSLITYASRKLEAHLGRGTR